MDQEPKLYAPDEVIAIIGYLNQEFNDNYGKALYHNANSFFSNGHCYHYAQVLNAIFPESKIYSDDQNTHCVTQIGKYKYDVNGMIYPDEASQYNFEIYSYPTTDPLGEMLMSPRGEAYQESAKIRDFLIETGKHKLNDKAETTTRKM